MLPTLKLKFHLAHILGDSASRLHERPAGLPTDNALTAPHALVPALGARAGAWLLGPGLAAALGPHCAGGGLAAPPDRVPAPL